MTASLYKPSLALVLAHEGGYVNHPKDPGGATNFGITQRVYDAYRKAHGLKQQSVKLISSTEVEQIYRNSYWKLIRGDDLPAGLDYAVFDYAVNSGVGRALRYLQAGLGFKGDDVDGVIGNMTLNAAREAMRKDEEKVIVSYCGDRMRFLRGLSTFGTFGTGWTRRVEGYKAGVQPFADSGVIDYAIGYARRDPVYSTPAAIGTRPGEVAGGKGTPTVAEQGERSYSEALSSGWGLQ